VTLPDKTLADSLGRYAAGLDAELALLRQLDALSARLSGSPAAADPDVLHRHIDERTRILQALLALEEDLQPLRRRLAEAHTVARRLPGFASVAGRHRDAAAIVQRILTVDEHSLDVLKQAGRERRDALQALEAGEATLSAYRRVVAPPPTSAAIVDERG
jgi:hypothetical protein